MMTELEDRCQCSWLAASYRRFSTGMGVIRRSADYCMLLNRKDVGRLARKSALRSMASNSRLLDG